MGGGGALGPECSRLMNGRRALDILDCSLIGRTGDILMGGPWKTMGPGGAGGAGGAPLPLPAFESRCNAMHFVQDPQLLTDKGQKVDILRNPKYNNTPARYLLRSFLLGC